MALTGWERDRSSAERRAAWKAAEAATTSDATRSPPVPRALQHDGRALVRLVSNAAADLAHIGLVLFLVACSLVRKVHCTALHRAWA